MIVGVSGATRLREAQQGCSVNLPFVSTSFQARITPFGGAETDAEEATVKPDGRAPVCATRIQRTPLESCQLASAPGAVVFAEAAVVNKAADRFAASSRLRLPSLAAAASKVFPLYSNTTGVEENSRCPAE